MFCKHMVYRSLYRVPKAEEQSKSDFLNPMLLWWTESTQKMAHFPIDAIDAIGSLGTEFAFS